ncbi:HAD family hydrolase [Jiangella rhizosphaerae]|uniref:HAD family hydrolase n=1 Tax=Jiangella rhizosphaerae TaxID=2293569 RepID=UPI001314E225|nr:HAD hydrolase-like protein [Jiangella rhizosphaerae]
MSASDLLVLFDWNGTLADDAERAREATNTVLRTRGLPELTAAAFAGSFRLPMTAFMAAIGVDPADLAGAVADWNTQMARRPPRLRTGAAALLRRLRAGGALVGVVSAAGAQAVRADLRACRLAADLDIVVTDAADKGDALHRHRGLRTHAAYVGDTEYDLECAHAAGFLPIGVTGGYRPAAALADAGPAALIDDLADLYDVLTCSRPST